MNVHVKMLGAGAPFDLLDLNRVLETKVPFLSRFIFFASSVVLEGKLCRSRVIVLVRGNTGVHIKCEGNGVV